MKGVKFLYGFIIVLGLLFIIRLTHILIYIPFDLKIILTNTPILFFIGLIYLERGFYYTIKKGYFNNKSIIKFKKGGLFFIFSGLISLIKSILLILQFNKSTEVINNIITYKNLSQSLLLLIIGIGFVVISDFIKKGSLLKKENDLTI